MCYRFVCQNCFTPTIVELPKSAVKVVEPVKNRDGSLLAIIVTCPKCGIRQEEAAWRFMPVLKR